MGPFHLQQKWKSDMRTKADSAVVSTNRRVLQSDGVKFTTGVAVATSALFKLNKVLTLSYWDTNAVSCGRQCGTLKPPGNGFAMSTQNATWPCGVCVMASVGLHTWTPLCVCVCRGLTNKLASVGNHSVFFAAESISRRHTVLNKKHSVE